MNSQLFFKHYPHRKDDSNKYDNGVILFISGSYGMAGACILNIIGAESVGVSYIHVLTDERIYPIVASKKICAVYHPDDLKDDNSIDTIDLSKIKAIGFGSGLNNHPHAKKYLEYLIDHTNIPLIIDAYGLNLLSQDKTLFRNKNMILTPHLGEFRQLTSLDIETITRNREQSAIEFVKTYGVTLVLKGPETLVVSKEGEIYKNDSGNSALATAGSGDVLTGMITGLSGKYENTYEAVKDAVWLHGHLADEAIKKHSREVFDLERYPEYADIFFKTNAF